MSRDVMVLAEYRNGAVDNLTIQLLGKGREVADKLGGQLAVLVLGFNLGELADQLGSSGVDAVLVADHPVLKDYRPEVYSKVIRDAVKRMNPALLLLGHTYHGMELGPAVATMLKSSMASNCVDLDLCDRVPTVVRPMFGGIVQSKIKLQGPPPFVVSFQRGALPLKTVPARNVSVVPVPVDIEDKDVVTRLIEVLQPAKGDVDITKAEVVVAVGRGIEAKANIQLAKDLADALGGVVACSRPISDMGWLPPEYHVGVTGRTVRPRVYIACGISGASQHIAGMQDAQLIIAVNKDSEAPIFRIAHYGVVGNLLEILPVFVRQARSSWRPVARCS